MNILDSNNIRTTTLIPQDQHLEFLCARPTIPAPPETVREWKALSMGDDEELEVGWSDIILDDEAELIDNAW